MGLAGVIVGVPAVFPATRALKGRLYGIAVTDVVSLGLACARLLLVTLGAEHFPARRATTVDAPVALR
jgi:hypothetical protein